MVTLVITALATAFVLTAIEELVRNLGKFRGLVAFLISLLGAYFTGPNDWGMIIFTAFAGAFAGLACSMSILNLIESREPRTLRGMPQRIPPL